MVYASLTCPPFIERFQIMCHIRFPLFIAPISHYVLQGVQIPNIFHTWAVGRTRNSKIELGIDVYDQVHRSLIIIHTWMMHDLEISLTSSNKFGDNWYFYPNTFCRIWIVILVYFIRTWTKWIGKNGHENSYILIQRRHC